MAAGITNMTHEKQAQPSSTDSHFTKTAFVVSTLALLIFSPLMFILGTIAGFGLHSYLEPNKKMKAGDPIITVPNAVFSIIGAVGAILRWTPAGMLGGFLFQWIPFVSSFAVGDTIYRAVR